MNGTMEAGSPMTKGATAVGDGRVRPGCGVAEVPTRAAVAAGVVRPPA